VRLMRNYQNESDEFREASAHNGGGNPEPSLVGRGRCRDYRVCIAIQVIPN